MFSSAPDWPRAAPLRPGSARHPAGALALLLFTSADAPRPAVTQGDKGYIQEISGVHLLPFTYLGAKHMMTGYDHIPFLFGVIFFPTSSSTSRCTSACLPSVTDHDGAGVYYNIGINSYLIDAVIGFLGGLQSAG